MSTRCERSRLPARRALQLSPGLADAHALLGYLHRLCDWDWAAAQAEARLALSIDPNGASALVLAGQVADTLGSWDDAVRLLRAALDRDPLNPDVFWSLATALYRAGRLTDAEAAYRRLIELAPDYDWAHGYLSKTLLAEGKIKEALEMVPAEPHEPTRLAIQAIALEAAGRRAEAAEATSALIAKYAGSNAYYIAMVFAARDDHEHALQWLERAYTQRDDGFVEIVGEHLFGKVANDVRYKAFLRKLNLPG